MIERFFAQRKRIVSITETLLISTCLQGGKYLQVVVICFALVLNIVIV